MIAISEINQHGNLIYASEIPFNLVNKTSTQRKWTIEQTVNQVLDYCIQVNKPLIIEQLDFEKKKQDFKLYDKDKRFYQMLSEFSYRLIIEKLYSRSYKVKIGINEVDSSYTSQIGKVKYSKIKEISVHRSASYVIAR